MPPLTTAGPRAITCRIMPRALIVGAGILGTAHALEAVERIGVTPKRQAIRGGTDGARLSYMGLLTPNVWAGGQNFHSVREWVSLEWMASAVEATLEILTVWVEKSA